MTLAEMNRDTVYVREYQGFSSAPNSIKIKVFKTFTSIELIFG